MNTDILSSIRWNIATFPVRAVLGLAISVIIVRSLCLSEGGLALYAFSVSLIQTSTTWAGFGVPTILTKETAQLIQSKRSDMAVDLFRNTALIRVPFNLVIGLIVVGVGVGLRSDNAFSMLTPTIFLLILLHTCFEDFSALATSIMNAKFDRAGSNLSVIFENFVLLILVLGIWIYGSTSPACILFAGATALTIKNLYAYKRIQSSQYTQKQSHKDSDQFPSVTKFWFSKKKQCAWAYFDKSINYFLSPAFALILLGVLGTAAEISNAFVVFEFSSRVIAVIAAPLGGILLPYLARRSPSPDPLSPESIGTRIMRLLVTVATLLSASCLSFGGVIFAALYGKSAAPLAFMGAIVASLAIIETVLHNGLSANAVAFSNAQDLVISRVTGACLFVLFCIAAPKNEMSIIYGLAMSRLSVPVALWILALYRGTLRFNGKSIVVLTIAWLGSVFVLTHAAKIIGEPSVSSAIVAGTASIAVVMAGIAIFDGRNARELIALGLQVIRR